MDLCGLVGVLVGDDSAGDEGSELAGAVGNIHSLHILTVVNELETAHQIERWV